MSGSNRLLNSKNTIEGNTQDRLMREQKNANAEAIEDVNEGIPTKKSYKKTSGRRRTK